MNNMKLLILVSVFICTLVGCSKESFKDNISINPPITDSTEVAYSTVLFNVLSEDIKPQSKCIVITPTAEAKVYNYNIYCFKRYSNERERFYSNSENPTSLRLSNGEWDFYVFANTDKDMGDMTREEVEKYKYSISKTLDIIKNMRLVMAHYSNAYITSNTTLSIELERFVARFEVNVTLSGEAKDYKIIKKEVINAAGECRVFGYNPPASKTVDFTTYKTFYAMENLQGTKNNITRPKDKNKYTAPSKATFIRITAQSNTHEITYDYYLGGNTTSDFNIRRNTKYAININITGQNTSDWRVNATPLNYFINMANRHLNINGSGAHDTWAFEFKAGDKQEINLEFFADIDNNEKLVTYFAMFFEEEHYDKYFQTEGYLDKYLLFRSKYGDPCVLFNFDEGQGGSGQKYATAKVRPNVRYRLVIFCHQFAGDPYSENNDIRVYMEKGTELEVYKDMHFSVYP